MSIGKLRDALGRSLSLVEAFGVTAEAREATLIGPLISAWPVVEELAAHMSRFAQLPLLIYVGDQMVFSTQVDQMPRWCAFLKNHPDLAQRCSGDEQRRATTEGCRSVCHAGMLVAQRRVALPMVGDMALLFGSRWGSTTEAENARARFLASLESERSAALVDLHRIAEESSAEGGSSSFTAQDEQIMDTIQRTLEILVEGTVTSQVRAVSMSHEVATVLQGTSLFVRDLVEETRALGHGRLLSDEFVESADIVEAENECALYLLQNFLSDSGYSEYREARPAQLETVPVGELVERLVRIYSRTERGRRLRFENQLPSDVPTVRGYRVELERALHNVFSNAVKYSFVSVGDAGERRIRVYARMPYATRGNQPEWALCVENYGVGLSREEQHRAFQRGFRGSQGIRQVGFGAGIGLSEVQKIMAGVGGRARIRSSFLHEGRTGAVHLTTVTLVFPLQQRGMIA